MQPNPGCPEKATAGQPLTLFVIKPLGKWGGMTSGCGSDNNRKVQYGFSVKVYMWKETLLGHIFNRRELPHLWAPLHSVTHNTVSCPEGCCRSYPFDTTQKKRSCCWICSGHGGDGACSGDKITEPSAIILKDSSFYSSQKMNRCYWDTKIYNLQRPLTKQGSKTHRGVYESECPLYIGMNFLPVLI